MTVTLSFVQLTVADLDRAAAWYHQVLDRPCSLFDPTGRFALFETGNVRLTLKEGASDPGSILLAFQVESLPSELQRLATVGVHPDGGIKQSPEGYRRALFRDPDGHRLSLFEWTADPTHPEA